MYLCVYADPETVTSNCAILSRSAIVCGGQIESGDAAAWPCASQRRLPYKNIEREKNKLCLRSLRCGWRCYSTVNAILMIWPRQTWADHVIARIRASMYARVNVVIQLLLQCNYSIGAFFLNASLGLCWYYRWDLTKQQIYIYTVFFQGQRHRATKAALRLSTKIR